MDKRSPLAFVILSIMLHLLFFTSAELILYRADVGRLVINPEMDIKIIDFTEDNTIPTEEPETAGVLGQKSTRAHDDRLDVERSDRPRSRTPMSPKPGAISNPIRERWLDIDPGRIVGGAPSTEPGKISESRRVAILAEPLETMGGSEKEKGAIRLETGRLEPVLNKRLEAEIPPPEIVTSPSPTPLPLERRDLTTNVEPLHRLKGGEKIETMLPEGGRMAPNPEGNLEIETSRPAMAPSPTRRTEPTGPRELMADVEPLDLSRGKVTPSPPRIGEKPLEKQAERSLPEAEMLPSADLLMPKAKEELYVKSDLLNVREGPSTGSKVLERLEKDEKLSLVDVDEEGGWYRVLLENGRIGYVKRELVYEKRQEAPPVTEADSGKGEVQPEGKELTVAAVEPKGEMKEEPRQPELSLGGIPADGQGEREKGRGVSKSGRDLNLLPDEVFKEYGQMVVSDVEASDGGDAVSLDTTEWRYFSYFSKIKREIEEVWRYPKEAALMEQEGELDMRFIVLRSGELKEARLIRSSGYRLLDEAAIGAVRDAAPFGPFPPNMDKDFIPIDARFRYILTGSGYRYQVHR